MEDNKKGQNEDHVKIYDKEMYISQEKLRTIIIMIAVFLIGFIAGYFSKDIIKEEIEETHQNKQLEITNQSNVAMIYDDII